jgi:hypothetical protein
MKLMIGTTSRAAGTIASIAGWTAFVNLVIAGSAARTAGVDHKP